MASAFAQSIFDALLDASQHIQRYEGLHRAGKTAAMATISASSLQEMLSQAQGHCHILMGYITGGDDIL